MSRIVVVVLAMLATTECRRKHHVEPSMISMPGTVTVLTGTAIAPPSADHCPTAPLIAAPVTINGDLTGAVSDSNERIDMTGYTWLGRDHFFAIDLQAGQALTLTLIEAGWDGGVYVFRNCSAINATTVAGLDTSPTRPLTFAAPATGRYCIAVDAWQLNTGSVYTFTVAPAVAMVPSIGVPPVPVPVVPPVMPVPTAAMGPALRAAPIADRCPTAQPVPVPSTVTGDLTNAHADSNDRIEVSGYAWQGRDHFFALVLTAGQHVQFTLNDEGNFDGGLYVFRDCSNIPGTAVAGLDTNPSSPLDFVAPTTGRYILAVDAWQPNTGGAYVLTIGM